MVRAVVDRVVDQLNSSLAPEQRLEKSPGTVLIGDAAVLDSLGLVNLVVALEQQIEHEFGVYVPLTENPDLLEEGGMCSTLGNLTEYVITLVEQQKLNG